MPSCVRSSKRRARAGAPEGEWMGRRAHPAPIGRALAVTLPALALTLVLACSSPPRTAPAPAPEAAPAAARPAEAPPPAPPRELRTLQIGLISKTFVQVPQWAAMANGYFAEEGLALEETYTGASTAAIAALV